MPLCVIFLKYYFGLLTTTVSYSCSHTQVRGGHTKIDLYASMNQTMSDDDDEEEDGGCSSALCLLDTHISVQLVYNNVNSNSWQLNLCLHHQHSSSALLCEISFGFMTACSLTNARVALPPSLGSNSRRCLFVLFCLFVVFSFRFPFGATAAVTPHGTRTGRGRR
jgi:hypothetical protein